MKYRPTVWTDAQGLAKNAMVHWVQKNADLPVHVTHPKSAPTGTRLPTVFLTGHIAKKKLIQPRPTLHSPPGPQLLYGFITTACIYSTWNKTLQTNGYDCLSISDNATQHAQFNI